MKAHIVTLPGDGIGPEVIREAVRVLAAIAGKFNHEFSFEEYLIGGCSIDQYGTALTETPPLVHVKKLTQSCLEPLGVHSGMTRLRQ